jgi:hypothetical protein
VQEADSRGGWPGLWLSGCGVYPSKSKPRSERDASGVCDTVKRFSPMGTGAGWKGPRAPDEVN